VGLKPEDVEGAALYTGNGCRDCRDIGFKGRLGIFEMMAMNATIRDMTFNGEAVHKIREEAERSGMRSLQGDGHRKILSGVTTVQEILAVTAAQD